MRWKGCPRRFERTRRRGVSEVAGPRGDGRTSRERLRNGEAGGHGSKAVVAELDLATGTGGRRASMQVCVFLAHKRCSEAGALFDHPGDGLVVRHHA